MSKDSPATKTSPWQPRTLIKYSLLQIPALGLVVAILLLLQTWLDFSSHLVWLGAGLWALKDAVMYPLVWKAYAPYLPDPSQDLLGLIGICREPLNPTGYVEVRGELWRARLAGGQNRFDPGEKVRVVAVTGLELIVEEITDEEK